MKIHNIFLKICGLKEIISSRSPDGTTDDENIIISVNQAYKITRKVIKTKKSLLRRNIVRIPINYSYLCFVFLTLFWSIILSLWEAIHYKDSIYVTTNMFNVMYCVQYIAGFIVYRKKFYKTAMINMKENRKYIYIAYLCSFILSLGLSITNVILLNEGVYINIYSDVYNVESYTYQILLSILLFVHKLYAYNVYFVNVITFSSILITQRIKINTYKKRIDNLIDTNNLDTTINDIIQDYTELQSYHSKIVRTLNNTFSSITLLGLAGCYFTTLYYTNDKIGIFTYVDIAVYLIIEIIYIHSINRIKNIIENIKIMIGSTKFVAKFLGKSDLVGLTGDIYDDYEISDTIINDESNTVVDDHDNIELSNIRISKNSTQRTSALKLIRNIINRRTNNNDVNKKVDIIKNMLYRDVILSYENNTNTDWLVLYTKLSEPWECFKLFGFNLDDDQLIKKFVLIVVGFIGILRLNTEFNL